MTKLWTNLKSVHFISEQTIGSTSGLLKYVSDEFLGKDDVNHHEISQLLKQIRLSNIGRVIIGHLNVNFFASKIDAIRTIIPGNVDIMPHAQQPILKWMASQILSD